MSKLNTSGNSTVATLVAAAVLAIAVAYFVPRNAPQIKTETAAAVTTGTSSAGADVAPAAVPPASGTPAIATSAGSRAVFVASAPGRVEPTGGEIRISSQIPGRISDVLVQVNDKVLSGDLLVRLDSSEIEARMSAAEAEISVRKADRDGEAAKNNLARDRRTAEDNVANIERALALNRAEFDRWQLARKAGAATSAETQSARDTVNSARQRLDEMRTALRRVQLTENLPTYTRFEAALSQARAEFSVADATLEKTKVRTPRDGTVLSVTATAGETVAPSPDQILIVIGDTSSLRVRAELEERDAAKVRVGQIAIIRSDAYPGRDFEGKVASFSGALGPSRIGAKGPRKPNDIDVLEIMVDLVGAPPLLPGMRVDVLLRPEDVKPATAAATTATPAPAAPKAN